MNLLKSSTIAIALSVAATATAVPARRLTTTVIQPDGTELTITSAGDEYSHYYLTDDRQAVLRGADGAYYFAEPGLNGIMPSKVLASGSVRRSAAQTAFLSSLDRNEMIRSINSARDRRTPRRQSRAASDVQQSISSDPSSTLGLLNNSFPRFGKVKTIVILVQFSDKKFTISKPNAFYNDMMNKKGFNSYGATGSARDWFDYCSGGLFEPQFDVYGPYTLSKNMKYYGGNDIYGNDANAAEMIAEAVQLADSDIDYSQYDMDNNGEVDNVYVFYAGFGESDNQNKLADTVWPHQWHMSYGGFNITADGVKVDKYATSNELGYYSNTPDGIGTFVHEFSHVMGIPDLYTTSSYDFGVDATATPGEWSIMDYGCYLNDGLTPPAYNVYERNALGWIDLDDLSECGGTLRLENISETNSGAIVHTDKPSEFFLLENRQQTGWDAYLPGHGMLIWHVDYNSTIFESNEVNNYGKHQYVDIVEASGEADNTSASALAAYTFPGTKNVVSFNGFDTWSGKKINLPLFDIEETNGVVTAHIATAPTVTPATDVSESGFTANWTSVPGAIDYKITVTTHVENKPVISTCDFGSGSTLRIPADWASSGRSIYTSTGNFGASSPALKMGTNGQTLQSPTYTDDISSVKFWAHQNAIPAESQSRLVILAGDQNSTNEIYSFNNWNEIKSEGKTISIDAIPSGTRQITFKYEKIGTGNIALDDIQIIVGGEMPLTLEGYDQKSTGGANSFTVTNLIDGVGSYDYSVVAVFDGYESEASSVMTVCTDASGIGDITTGTDAPTGYYTFQGIRVDNPVHGQIYILVNGGKASKIRF